LPVTEIDLLEIIPGRGLHIRTRQESLGDLLARGASIGRIAPGPLLPGRSIACRVPANPSIRHPKPRNRTATAPKACWNLNDVFGITNAFLKATTCWALLGQVFTLSGDFLRIPVGRPKIGSLPVDPVFIREYGGWAGIIPSSSTRHALQKWLRSKGLRASRGAVEPRFSSLPSSVLDAAVSQGGSACSESFSDGQGFEPWVPVKEHTLSKRAQSTALPPI